MRTVLVTGAAGFIGSHVVDALLAKGDKVIGVDCFNDYYDPQVKEKNISQHKDNPNFVLYRDDIVDMKAMRIVFSKHKIDKICHLAARAGVRPSIQEPLLYNEVNITGTLNLLELAREFNVKYFVSASSSSVYGKNKKVPFSETDNVDNPVSPYAATKKAGELLCYTYSHLYNINVTCLRFFTVYGPRGRPDMAPYMFTKNIMEGKSIKKFGNGSSKRDYTYIADITDGVIKALDKEFRYEIINLGNSDTIDLNSFISLVEEITNKKAIIEQLPDQPGDVPITYADPKKAEELLGFKAKTSFREGMRKFYEWYTK
jgi:UDP-glucuronate 4-epimerase